MDERRLIREFLSKMEEVCHACGHNPCRCVELCGTCHCDPCECPGHSKKDCDYSLDSMEDGQAHHEMKIEDDGSISPHELFHHFDLNDDGRVTPQEYVDHIEYHAKHPESLDHYKHLRNQSYQSVPCRTSYDSCSQHLLNCPEEIEICLQPLMDKTGSTCKESSLRSMIDVLQSLVKCGLF